MLLTITIGLNPVKAEEGKWIYFPSSSPTLFNINTITRINFYINDQDELTINFLTPNNTNNIMTIADIQDLESANLFLQKITEFIKSKDEHFLNVQEIYNKLEN